MKKSFLIYLLLIPVILTSCEIPIKITNNENTIKGEEVVNNVFNLSHGDYTYPIYIKKVNINGTDCIIALSNIKEGMNMSCNWK